jgi:hypothetical protein
MVGASSLMPVTNSLAYFGGVSGLQAFSGIPWSIILLECFLTVTTNRIAYLYGASSLMPVTNSLAYFGGVSG